MFAGRGARDFFDELNVESHVGAQDFKDGLPELWQAAVGGGLVWCDDLEVDAIEFLLDDLELFDPIEFLE